MLQFLEIEHCGVMYILHSIEIYLGLRDLLHQTDKTMHASRYTFTKITMNLYLCRHVCLMVETYIFHIYTLFCSFLLCGWKAGKMAWHSVR